MYVCMYVQYVCVCIYIYIYIYIYIRVAFMYMRLAPPCCSTAVWAV